MACLAERLREESRIPRLLPVSDGRNQRWKAVQIFAEDVLLPPNSCICNIVGKLIEVDVGGYQLSSKDLQKIQQDHPDLLVEWVDCETLCFQMPSSSTTDLASKFEFQIICYLRRHRRNTELDTRPSSSLFKVTNPNGPQGKNICADLTIFDRRGYKQKVDAAHSQRRTVPKGVRVIATIEVQNWSQSEDQIREACQKESLYMDCTSIAIFVKTGYIEIFNPRGSRVCSLYNPAYIEVGYYCNELQGLRLYLDPLRDAEGWPFPTHPDSYCFEQDLAEPHSNLVAAIQGGNFVMATNIVNYVFSLNVPQQPLLEAVRKAAQIQTPAAHGFVRYLLDNGAEPSQDMQQISEILVATAAKDQALIDLLRQYGAPAPDISSDLLVAAVQRRDVEFATLLIRGGADPNQPSANGELALVAAIQFMPMVEAIVNTAGHVDVRKKNYCGLSALYWAKKMKNQQLVQFLEEKEG